LFLSSCSSLHSRPPSPSLSPYTTLFRSSSRPLTYAPFGPVPTCQAFHAGRDEVDPLQVAGLRARGFSWNQIAHKLEVGRGMAEQIGRAHRLNSSHEWISYAVFCLKQTKT